MNSMEVQSSQSERVKPNADFGARPPKPIAEDPVQALKHRLQPIVMAHDFVESEWENVLYALITVKEPKTELHVILSALPYRHKMIDRLDMLNSMANLGYFSKELQNT